VRPAEAERHAEALRRPDRDVGAEFAGWREQSERKKVRRDDDECAGGMRCFDQRAQVTNGAGRARVLSQDAEGVVGQRVGEILHDDAHPLREGTGAHHVQGLRQHVGVDDEGVCAAAGRGGSSAGKRHRLGGSG